MSGKTFLNVITKFSGSNVKTISLKWLQIDAISEFISLLGNRFTCTFRYPVLLHVNYLDTTGLPAVQRNNPLQ